MDWFKTLTQWRDDRNNVAQLRFEIERNSEDFHRLVEQRGLKEGKPEFENEYSRFRNEYDLLSVEIDKIETRRMLALAFRWGVPIPQRPGKAYEDNEWWDWNTIHHRHYLSDVGKQKIRREAAEEADIFYRPWLSWGAIAISVVALIVSVLKP